MASNSVKQFTKCISEVEIRGTNESWEESYKKCDKEIHSGLSKLAEIKPGLEKYFERAMEPESSRRCLERQLKILGPLILINAKLAVRIVIPSGNQRVYGTGFIQRVRRQRKMKAVEIEGQLTKRVSESGVLTVSTVHHVLNPDSLKGEKIDFQAARIEIFLNDKEEDMKVVKGFTIVESDKDINTFDWCSFECCTNDMGLIDALGKSINELEELQKQAYNFYKSVLLKKINEDEIAELTEENEEGKNAEIQPSKSDDKRDPDENMDKQNSASVDKVISDKKNGKRVSELDDQDNNKEQISNSPQPMPEKSRELLSNFVTVVGYPHGGPRRISFGKRTKPKRIQKQVRDQQEWCCYYHDAETCQGNSGSPVYILGQPVCGYGYWFGHQHNHSGYVVDKNVKVKVTSIGVDHANGA
ncbi:hypothetical protein Btru_002559 [Bulinus truncatus]|nr:hypothetical protein Btru_002559 [Bulinus truncatus]